MFRWSPALHGSLRHAVFGGHRYPVREPRATKDVPFPEQYADLPGGPQSLRLAPGWSMEVTQAVSVDELD